MWLNRILTIKNFTKVSVMSEEDNPNTNINVTFEVSQKLVAKLHNKINHQEQQIRDLQKHTEKWQTAYETLLVQQQQLIEREHFLQNKINKLTPTRTTDSSYEDTVVQTVKNDILPKAAKLSSYGLVETRTQKFDRRKIKTSTSDK